MLSDTWIWAWVAGWLIPLVFLKPQISLLVFLSPLILSALAAVLFVAVMVLAFTIGLPFLLLWAVFFA